MQAMMDVVHNSFQQDYCSKKDVKKPVFPLSVLQGNYSTERKGQTNRSSSKGM